LSGSAGTPDRRQSAGSFCPFDLPSYVFHRRGAEIAEVEIFVFLYRKKIDKGTDYLTKSHGFFAVSISAYIAFVFALSFQPSALSYIFALDSQSDRNVFVSRNKPLADNEPRVEGKNVTD
jgi:hypothetical protein